MYQFSSSYSVQHTAVVWSRSSRLALHPYNQVLILEKKIFFRFENLTKSIEIWLCEIINLNLSVSCNNVWPLTNSFGVACRDSYWGTSYAQNLRGTEPEIDIKLTRWTRQQTKILKKIRFYPLYFHIVYSIIVQKRQQAAARCKCCTE